ncbi:MAG: FxLYD domain-containing protein [Acidobacteriota bacterium]
MFRAVVTGPEDVRVVDASVELSRRDDGIRVVALGWIANGSDRALEDLEVVVSLFDDQGRLVDSLHHRGLESVAPGERTPFRIVEPRPEATRSWTRHEAVVVRGRKAGGGSAQPITEREEMRIREEEGAPVEVVAVGLVRNEGQSDQIRHLRIGFFDAEGQLLDVVSESDGPPIGPGKSRGYQASAELLWPSERYARATVVGWNASGW